MVENILSIVLLLVLIAFVFVTSFLEDKRKERLKKYQDTLSEHDKSVIADYLVQGRYFVKNERKCKQTEKKVK